MSTDIKNIDGIGPKNEKKLNEYGIFTIEDLRKEGETEEGRKKLSEETGIYLKWIENWVEQAKSHKVEEVVEKVEEVKEIEKVEKAQKVINNDEYSELLEKAGFKSSKDLASIKPLDLLDKIYQTNQKYNLVPRMPSINQIVRWIEQAKKEV